MSWLIITISAYLILAVVFLIDKYLLVGPIPNPKLYAFYIGVLGIAVIIFIPFINFYLPTFWEVFLSFVSGASFVCAIFWFFKGLRIFEPSRIVPAVGGILPIFTFLLIFLFSKGRETLDLFGFLAFLLLIAGTILITYEKSKRVSLKSLKISLAASFLFALSFVFAKYVYMANPFLVGLVWIRVGGAVTALFFLSSKEVREGLFQQKIGLEKKTVAVFLSSQAGGAGANILQNWAVALAPLAYVAMINALQGVQYVFLLVFAILLSLKFPKILKEEISKEVLLQKIIAILLIGGGLALLALR
jgi:drug/metabolite transporter (DMT)-like permease